MPKKDDTDEGYLERLLSLYEEKSKSFTRAFSILLGVAIFFLFIIFIPYVSIIDNKYEISQDLKNIPIILNNLTDIQNKSNVLKSNFKNDEYYMKTFYERILKNHASNVNDCFNNKKATRLIQITEKEIPNITTMYRDNSFWNLDICQKYGVTEPPNFNTTLHFYLNNITNPEKTYSAFLSYSGMNKQQQHDSPTLNKIQISMLEYLNSSWHGGSKFWINHTNKNKIEPTFSKHSKDTDNLINKINNLNVLTESTRSQSKIFKKPLANESLDDLRNSVDSLKDYVDGLKTIYLQEITQILYNALELSIQNNNQNSISELLDKQYTPAISDKVKDSEHIFNDINRIIGGHLKNYKEIETSLKEEMIILQNKENETTERLKEIEFPFGKIPIGINESISFFPIGLSLGFLICASLFVDTALLRKSYHKYS